MTKNQIQIAYLVKRYRYKHKDDKKALEALEKILWHSYPVVYPKWETESRQITYAIDRRREKKKRVNRYLGEMADYYDSLYFVTLTFNDESLERLNERTRHRYAQQWLNENCKDYFANVDYGKKNGREHFHAVVAFKDTYTEWQYGFKSVKSAKIADETADRWKISSYLLKLTNHASKLGTGKSFRKKCREDVDKLPF